ncbi:MAG: type I-E CRISPR-associated protein Cas5/CasD [Pigmentiphaga sp.]|uniref:type I-E CRISPR-associated protein Cas5/CasD n=1 Tax=Pigmentiphaga sp. TaxID=1977564 RepID=UPI0029A6DFD9|nr:type I-E CRISPR-associated protein Cas5/CasD [Pigmentiphaga sp.]MDX3905108.1 type I-E CRISPR-associated protein Cas5/CasD [Pigmentiphaga sp.]
MATLLLQLYGPMQSWGTTSRYDERDTQLEPSKSGVIGLVCAALGRERESPVDDLAALRMGVRVDREGIVMRDYQTATGVAIASSGKADAGRTIVSPRYFLADAVFLVGLEGQHSLLDQIDQALRRPRWPLALGRKSFVPSKPVHLPGALLALPLVQALAVWPDLVDDTPADMSKRGVVEDASEGSVRMDQPIAAFAQRQFGPRFVKPVFFRPGGKHAPEQAAA